MTTHVTRAVHDDTIFVNGRILTMDGPSPEYAEAVAISGGRIVTCGSRAEAEAALPAARIRDLKGATLLPGFIDAHSHLSYGCELVNQVDVSAPPVGHCTDIPSIVAALEAFRDARGIAAGEWIGGYGYDQDTLAEKRHIIKGDLDAAFPDNPVILTHISSHGAVLNSLALAAVGIDASTATPSGGIIARVGDTQEPAGLVMERAYLEIVQPRVPHADQAQLLETLDAVQQLYASQGYTHAQDGFSTKAEFELFTAAADAGLLYLDVASLGSFLEAPHWVANTAYPREEYRNGYRIAGMKIVQDGSPQGRTAHVHEPYLTGGPAGQTDWHGQPSMPYEQLAMVIAKAKEAGVHVYSHVNGDAAIDDFIRALREAGWTAADDHRTVAIHSQFQRPDHLDAYVELGVSPSYFTSHCFFWGDVHERNLGAERAAFISPMKAAMDAGLIVSNHSDYPVTPFDPMLIIWTALTRESRTGVVHGPDQRVDAYAALRALTTGPAFQLFEEDRKGRIKVGLLADFVVLSADPTQTAAESIRSLSVVETIKEGVTVYACAVEPVVAEAAV